MEGRTISALGSGAAGGAGVRGGRRRGSDWRSALRWVVGVLERASVPYQVVGGVAAVLYGSHRTVADVDVDIPLSAENWSKLRPELVRGTSSITGPADYSDDHWRMRHVEMVHAATGVVVELGNAEVEMFNSSTGEWQRHAANFRASVPVPVGDGGPPVLVIPKLELLAYKAKVARDVDLIDVDHLTRDTSAEPFWPSAGGWVHGERREPAIQVHKHAEGAYVLRLSQAVNYEGNFMYLFVGEVIALLLDSGPIADHDKVPLRDTVLGILDSLAPAGGDRVDLVVAHTHAHGDHVTGDEQFKGVPNCVVVGHDPASVCAAFGMDAAAWPDAAPTAVELGERTLDIFACPGHEGSDIAVYDRRTGLLVTGDTLYPGRLYVRDESAFRASVTRMVNFVTTHSISWIAGAHIEMTSTPGIEFPHGDTCQREEHSLELDAEAVFELEQAMEDLRVKGRFVRHVCRDFVIVPVAPGGNSFNPDGPTSAAGAAGAGGAACDPGAGAEALEAEPPVQLISGKHEEALTGLAELLEADEAIGRDCVKAVRGCLKRVVNKPRDPKYRRIKGTSPGFYKRIGRYPAALAFLRVLGWETVDLDYGADPAGVAAGDLSAKYAGLGSGLGVMYVDKIRSTLQPAVLRKLHFDDGDPPYVTITFPHGSPTGITEKQTDLARLKSEWLQMQLFYAGSREESLQLRTLAAAMERLDKLGK